MKNRPPKSRAPRRPSAGLGALRSFYARYVAAVAGVKDERISAAFAAVAREDFMGAGPWQVAVAGGYIATHTDDPRVLYQNILIGLKTEAGINNGQPTLHAKCLEMAEPRTDDVVIHVGAGTGYYTAILAHLVGRKGKVVAYEIDRELAMRARENLAPWAMVRVRRQSAVAARLPVADVIYVCAGASHIPAAFLDGLAIGGRLVLPLTPNERAGCMLLVTRASANEFAAKIFSPAAFIPCIGARDDAASTALATALAGGGADRVRSLRRTEAPDASAWCIGSGWWLSTTDASAR